MTLDAGYSFVEDGVDDARADEMIRMSEPFLQYLRNAPPSMQAVNLINWENIAEKPISSSNYIWLEQLTRLVLHSLAQHEFLKVVKIHLPIVSVEALTKFAATTRIQSLEKELITFRAAKDCKEIEAAISDAVCSIRT